MNRPKLPLAVLAILYGGLTVLAIVTYPRLPDRVATHFGADGTPNGWMSRSKHTAFTLGVTAITTLICAGGGYVMRFLSDSAVNIPHRDYWLAPERRRETYDKLASLGLWIACLMAAHFVGFHLLIVRANAQGAAPARLPAQEVRGLVLAFLAGVLGLAVYARGWMWRVDDPDSLRNPR